MHQHAVHVALLWSDAAFADTAPDVIRRVMAVNFFGAMHATHAALPALRHARGMVMAISSVAGFAPLIHRTGYAAKSEHLWMAASSSWTASLAMAVS